MCVCGGNAYSYVKINSFNLLNYDILLRHMTMLSRKRQRILGFKFILTETPQN